MTRSGASSTVTGAIRRLMSALGGSCPGSRREVPTDKAPRPPSLTNSRRFTDRSPVQRVSALVIFRTTLEPVMKRLRRATVVVLLGLSTTLLAAQRGGFQRRFMPSDEYAATGDSKHEFAWS